MTGPVVFCATGKTGFGHLRRVCTVARSLRDLAPDLDLELMTNARPGGISDEWSLPFSHVERVDRADMAARLAARTPGGVVVDTARIPGLEHVSAPCCLILREVGPEHLSRFAIADRPWELVLIPNPRPEWSPELDSRFARLVEWVGWIHRGQPVPSTRSAAGRRVLLSTAGGGSPESRAGFARRVQPLLGAIRNVGPHRVDIWGVAPSSGNGAPALDLDATIEPTSNLGATFGEWDLVISTAGYNSVIELAMTEVPAVLVPIPRTYDDQAKRARQWGWRLGAAIELDAPVTDDVVAWARVVLAEGRRRSSFPLGPSGSARAARLVEAMAT